MRPGVGRRLRRHNKAFAKSWAFGCNSSKIKALEARCNHSYKQSIAGVKEQGVYLSTLTAEYPPSLALQLAQIGIGRVSATGSFRQALPLHSAGFRSATEQECTRPQTGAIQSQNTHCKQWPGPGCIGCMSVNWCRESWRTSGMALHSPSRKPGSGKNGLHGSAIALPSRHEPRGRTAVQTPSAAGFGQLLG